MPARRDFVEQLVNNVRADSNGCWIWVGTTDERGYGRVKVQGATLFSHRWVFAELRAAIPYGCELDHLCRNHACCNPDHLEAVSHLINVQRGFDARGTAPTCRRGHPRSLYGRFSQGRWHCRECHRVARFKRAGRDVPPTYLICDRCARRISSSQMASHERACQRRQTTFAAQRGAA